MSDEKITVGDILDGVSLWDEHKPQSGEDWVKVAERFVADGDSTEQSSPLFAGLVLAVAELVRERARADELEKQLKQAEERASDADADWHACFEKLSTAERRADELREALRTLEKAATRWYVFVRQAEQELYPNTPTLKDAVAEARAALSGDET